MFPFLNWQIVDFPRHLDVTARWKKILQTFVQECTCRCTVNLCRVWHMYQERWFRFRFNYTWTRHDRPFVRESMYQSLVDSSHKGWVMRSFDAPFVLNKLLSKQSSWRWFETPLRSCYVTVKLFQWIPHPHCLFTTWKKYFSYIELHLKNSLSYYIFIYFLFMGTTIKVVILLHVYKETHHCFSVCNASPTL